MIDELAACCGGAKYNPITSAAFVPADASVHRLAPESPGNQFERYIPEAISVIGIESVCGYAAAEIGRSLGHHVRFSAVFEITAADPIQ